MVYSFFHGSKHLGHLRPDELKRPPYVGAEMETPMGKLPVVSCLRYTETDTTYVQLGNAPVAPSAA